MECLARGHDVLHCEARCHMKIFDIVAVCFRVWRFLIDLANGMNKYLFIEYLVVDCPRCHQQMRLC